MNKQRIILIILGLTLALGSAYGMYKFTGNMEKKVAVAVVTKNIKAYGKFEPGNVQMTQLPAKYVLPNAVTNINMLEGKEALVNMYQGEQVLQDRVGEGAVKPSEDERLFFIPAKDVVMRPGQKVDIYMVYTPGKSVYEGVERLLSGKTVASVIGDTGQNTYGLNINDTAKSQSGIEIYLTHEEITLYLDRKQYAKEVIVRYEEGGRV